MNRPLLLAAALLLSACSTQIQHGLDERDANEIVSALVSRGFEARKVPEKGKRPTWAVELDDRQASEAMRVLIELKLPRPPRLKTQALAQSVGLIDTPGAERLRQLEAQEGDIEESLETMDGVASAAVELVVPPAPRPGVTSAPSKASVLVRVQPLALERLQQQRGELKALVAAAVDGLHAEDVVLVIDPVVVPAPPAPPESPWRPVVLTAGAALALLALGLIGVGVRLRQRNKTAAPGPAPTAAAPRPVINPAVQRKAA